MPQQQTHWWDVLFGVPMSVCPVCLVFPFIFNQVGHLLLQALKPYRGVNFPYQHFSVDTTKLFQKALMLLKERALIISSVARETLVVTSTFAKAWTAIDEET